MTKILFDVGANWGVDSLETIKNNPDWVCYAFEPTPRLAEHLRQASAAFADRYHVYEYAISDENTDAVFNVAGQADWGCSSLLQFSDNLDKSWPGRTDFVVTEQIPVKVITLAYFFEKILPNLFVVPQIEYFHCDTQGNDLKVLKGMGHYISKIKRGVIEVPMSTNVMLYKGQHTKEEAVDYLEQNGFAIENFGVQQNELNVYFKNLRMMT